MKAARVGRIVGRCVLVLALGACGKSDRASEQGSGTIVASRVLADIQLTAPEGWTSSYDQDADAWQLASGAATVRIERADERYVASPDSYMQHVAPRWGTDKLVTIEHREQIGGGFAMTLAVFASKSDPQPLRATYVVRKLGKVWYRCYADGVADEALRTQVIALCRSVRR